MTSGGNETLYQAMWTDDDISYADAVQGWYYAAVAELLRDDLAETSAWQEYDRLVKEVFGG